MATHLRSYTSIKTLADICDAIASGLDSDPLTRALAPRWRELGAVADEYLEAQASLERQLRRARIDLAVCDARWEPEAAAFARRIIDQSGGPRGPLYQRFFSEHSPSSAQQLRPEAELRLGLRWLEELSHEAPAPLAEFRPRLALVTEALNTALQTREILEEEQGQLDASIGRLLAEVNLELGSLEATLQEIFPGQPRRVASYLSAARPD